MYVLVYGFLIKCFAIKQGPLPTRLAADMETDDETTYQQLDSPCVLL